MTKKLIICALLSFTVNFAFGQDKLQAFSLNEVRLLDGPFKAAQQTDLAYMLSLNPDRLLAPYLKDAGLPTKAEQYGNWENTGLDGHMAGHYLSALSLMYGSTADVKVKEKIDYVISELEKCQVKNGNGYVGGVPGGKAIWEEIKHGKIRANSFSLNGKWVPLYNIHKIYNGLYDAYAVTGNLKAKNILIKLTDWCIDLVENLSDAQVQEMLKSEHGGLNEIFANVAAITGDKKYLALAKKFSDLSILNPLLNQKDALNGLHANTQIPKVIGFEQVAKVANDATWANAAYFFWQTVVKNRTISIGGNSVREHFNPINNFSSMIDSREGPETCNSYNMLRLTKQLFLANPSANYVDYYERTLYNHILSSQSKTGGFVYFTPIRPGHYRVYSNAQEGFWCCVGSGLENHAKYGELIYAHSKTDLFVNLYIPSTLNWKEKGLSITQQTTFPNSETSKLSVKINKPSSFAINFRYPAWVTNNTLTIFINGKKQVVTKNAAGYASIYRLWKTGDVVNITLPMHTSTEFLPDQSNWVSFLHGPIVLASEIDTLKPKKLIADGSRMGHIASETLFPIDKAPLIVGSKDNLATKIKSGATNMQFNASNLIYQAQYKNLKLVPFYEIQGSRYMLYWPYTNEAGLQEKVAYINKIEKTKNELDAQTVDVINTGEQQPESDHNFKGEQTENGTFLERHFRNSKDWFSYELNNPKLNASKLRLTLYGKDKNKNFEVYINKIIMTTVNLDGSKGDGFYEVEYEIPAFLRKEKMEVKFVAQNKSQVANIYEVRLMK
ncbi:glycoside hydrolase family 127 protein [Pedobacter frigiditerrae]|uniref:glycoside hydrolase family 127 protein n=1 Tax=Pedobacter frigiditerrae TaxID=2530452 RepID=UPI00292DC885|nr:glycoside hydrolase family 127 protein [Pedobacter frigiditerrae]